MDDEDIASTIAGRVRAGRVRIGLTRKQLAAAAGVSERYLNELENGSANASVGILVKIARALGQDFVQLVAARADFGDANEFAAFASGLTSAERRAALAVLERWREEHRRGARGLALLGLRGAGKTTLGRSLAERKGLRFVSVTREIEGRAGMSLADLFNLAGIDAYRALEIDVVRDWASRADGIVLETAGGIADNAEALDMVLAGFTSVWLKASPEEHLSRVAAQGDTRPMRGNPRALDHLVGLLARREPAYARAHRFVDTSGRTVEASLADLEQITASMLEARNAHG